MSLDLLNANKEHKLNITIEFDTRQTLTPRMNEIADAFGLGVSEEKKFTIFKDFKIGFSKGDVVFITGDSGGGKSLLLKEIRNQLKAKECMSFNDISIDGSAIIIDTIGKDTNEAINYLSLMGLNDAFIFLRKYCELSDGQKYRFKLACLLYEKPEFLFIDEFCANLDRTTAKVISYNLQRICRDLGITVFCATTHTDIKDDLNPSVLVRKSFMDDVVINYYEPIKSPISFSNAVTMRSGTIDEYDKLSKYHYKNTNSRLPYTKVVVAEYDKDIVGVVVFTPTFLKTKGRTILFGKEYSSMDKETIKRVNENFTRISRFVISPKFRACGLGVKLLKESFKFMKDKKYIETVTVMGNYNPVFEKAGFKKIEITDDEDPGAVNFKEYLKKLNINEDEIHNPAYLCMHIDSLKDEEKAMLKRLTEKILHHPKINFHLRTGTKRVARDSTKDDFINSDFILVRDKIIEYIPKLFSGNTLYYIIENPNYEKKNVKSLSSFV